MTFSCFDVLDSYVTIYYVYVHMPYCHLLQPSCFEFVPWVYYSPVSEKLKRFIRSDTFANIIAFLLVINLIAVIIETTVWVIPLMKLQLPMWFHWISLQIFFLFYFGDFWVFFSFVVVTAQLDIADSTAQQFWQIVEFVFGTN